MGFFRKWSRLLFSIIGAFLFVGLDSSVAEKPGMVFQPDINVGGYAQICYADEENTNSEFALKRARIKLSGAVAEKIDYEVLADFVRTDNLLYVGQIVYKHNKYLNLTLGQFKTPFSYEYLTSSTKLDTIDTAQVISELSSKYDIGVQVGGKISCIKYAFGVFNGEGRNNSDVNNHKDFAGRVVLTALKGLELGVARYDGKNGVLPKNKIRTGGHLSYIYKHLCLKGEYITAEDGFVNKKGWYGQITYKITPNSQPLLKYDVYDPDDADKYDNITLGVNWFIDKSVKLQVNYLIRDEETNDISNNMFASQFQVTF